MADGFGGSGYIDAAGNWVSTETPGMTINTPQPRIITTPNSSTGQPAYADPAAPSLSPEFATPEGGALTTLTPNSRTGAPAPGIRNLPATQNLGSGQQYVQNLIKNYGAAYVRQNLPAIADAAALPVAVVMSLVTPTDQLAPPSRDEAPPWSWPTQTVRPGAPLPASGLPAPKPVTQSGPGRSPSGPAPPAAPPPPGVAPPVPPGGAPPSPPTRPMAAIPPLPLPGGARAPTVQKGAPSSVNLGYGAPQAGIPPAPSSMFTTIDRPNADIAGGQSVAGQLAPQYFTRAYEPGGPAQMGALDLSRLFGGGQPATAAPIAATAQPRVPGPMAAIPRSARAAPAQVYHPSQLFPKIGGLGAPGSFGDPVTSNLTPSQLSPDAINRIRAGRRMFF